jgi:uroporphyrinogen decarboxylase
MDTTIAYLRKQIIAGADVQVFDSWGGLLSPDDFEEFSLRYIRQIITALKGMAPTILFAKGAWHSLEPMAATGATALGIDWCITPKWQENLYPRCTGNFDPAKLVSPIPVIKKEVKQMLAAFDKII